jgi:hypothetical protein
MNNQKAGALTLQNNLSTYEVEGVVYRGLLAGLSGATCQSAVVEYPPILQTVFARVLARYNQAMRMLIEQNREWATDYQHAPNPFVQVDLVGLTPAYLNFVAELGANPDEDVLNFLTEDMLANLFEIDGLLTMYAFRASTIPWFEDNFRSALATLRRRSGQKLIGLCPTRTQYREIAHKEHEHMEDYFDSVQLLSDSFAVDEDALYYIRGQAALSTLRAKSNHTFLAQDDPDYLQNAAWRRQLKAQTLTANIGALSDTKAYLPLLNRGEVITTADDINDSLMSQLQRLAGANGKVRYKPRDGVHGSYGSGSISLDGGGKPLSKLRRAASKWGALILQPQLEVPQVIIENKPYVYMDKLHFFNDAASGTTQLLGGQRICLPEASTEGQKRNIHGHAEAVYLPIKLN